MRFYSTLNPKRGQAHALLSLLRICCASLLCASRWCVRAHVCVAVPEASLGFRQRPQRMALWAGTGASVSHAAAPIGSYTTELSCVWHFARVPFPNVTLRSRAGIAARVHCTAAGIWGARTCLPTTTWPLRPSRYRRRGARSLCARVSMRLCTRVSMRLCARVSGAMARGCRRFLARDHGEGGQ